jgi:hypothetical protein
VAFTWRDRDRRTEGTLVMEAGDELEGEGDGQHIDDAVRATRAPRTRWTNSTIMSSLSVLTPALGQFGEDR